MHDIIIIGSGPAGLSAAIYARRAMLDTVVLEKDYMGSGQIAVTDRVDNYPGLQGISGYELGEKFREHAVLLGASVINAEVKKIEKTEKGFLLRLSSGEPIEGKALIYAAGTSYRHLNIDGDGMMGVSYCAVCDGAFYKGKTVCVIGGGDTALGDALYLSRLAETVYLVHRRDEFRANKSLCQNIKNTENIIPVLNSVPVKINGNGRVSSITLNCDGTEKEIKTDGVFVAIGSIPNTDLLDGICRLDSSGYVIAGEDCKTNVEGIFAAGDVRTTNLRQVCTAVSDGARALNSAEIYLSEIK